MNTIPQNDELLKQLVQLLRAHRSAFGQEEAVFREVTGDLHATLAGGFGAFAAGGGAAVYVDVLVFVFAFFCIGRLDFLLN